MRLRPSSVLGSYYAGRNAGAVQQLGAARSGPPSQWVYGPTGVGKSHLLQALCARAGAMNEPAAYLPLRESGQNPEVLSGCEALSLICLDDFDVVIGDPAWERAVFRLYTELEDRSGRLLIAATPPPSGTPIKLRDLASRLGAGAIVRLEQLDDEEQIAALQLRATRLGLELPQEVAQYLMRRLPRDMHSQCDALDRLDEASLATQRRLTVPFVREALEQHSAAAR